MADRRKCPECGVSVKLENLASHYERQHPRARVPDELTEEATKATRVAKATGRPRRATTASERRLYLVGAVIVVIIVVAAIVVQSLGSGLVGKLAPDFTLSASDGSGNVDLARYRGRVVLLDFMATTCEFCQVFTRDTLVPMHSGADGSKFVILSIDINKEGDTLTTGNPRIERFKTDYSATWTYALDTKGVSTNPYGVRGTPTHYIIDKDGIIRDYSQGAESIADLTARLSKYW